MTKKQRKKTTPPPPLRSRRYTLYTRDTSYDILFWFVMIIFFAVGIGVVHEQQYFVSLIPFSLVGFSVYSKLKEVQKLDLFEDTMFVEYIDLTETCQAKDIDTIQWVSVPHIGRHGHIEFSTVLLIKAKRGKKFQIPPIKEFDIEKSLSEWLNKHQKVSDYSAVVNE